MSFVRYNTEDSVISAETVVRGLWSNDNYTLSTFFTSSTSNQYYTDVFQSTTSPSGSAVQFSIQYGNLYGSGSTDINPNIIGYSPSRIVYGQYRNLVYGTETTNFSFDSNGTVATDVFIINISRARYKEALLPGSFNLTLTSGSTSTYLTDDSGTTNLTRFIGENRYYNIISGSNGTYYTTGTSSEILGFFLPDLNVVILNPSSSISASIAPASAVSSSIRLFNSIKTGASFTLNSSETISSRYFFTRVKNGDFNYTTNPSIIDENGNILYSTLIDNPQTYITTVGMYNDNNELLAVAKLSKPLIKDFTKEALVRIKLDY